jgi:hypothetical protein
MLITQKAEAVFCMLLLVLLHKYKPILITNLKINQITKTLRRFQIIKKNKYKIKVSKKNKNKIFLLNKITKKYAFPQNPLNRYQNYKIYLHNFCITLIRTRINTF